MADNPNVIQLHDHVTEMSPSAVRLLKFLGEGLMLRKDLDDRGRGTGDLFVSICMSVYKICTKYIAMKLCNFL